MNAAYKVAEYLPFGLSRKLANVNPLIVNYHMVSDTVKPYVWHLYHYRSVKTFVNDVQFLKKNFVLLSMPEFLDYRKRRRNLPVNSAMITFDDGFREMYDSVAPILTENRIPATFFLTRDFIDNRTLNYDNKKSLIIDKLAGFKDQKKIEEIRRLLELNDGINLSSIILNLKVNQRPLIDQLLHIFNIDIHEFLSETRPYLTSQQVAEMKDSGFDFGGHSVDHPNFAELSLNEQVFQALNSSDYVCESFNAGYRVFAFPYSDHNVSRQFFETINGKIDATFGTSGLYDDEITSHYQRISVEKLAYPIKTSINYFLSKRILNQMAGRNVIKRI